MDSANRTLIHMKNLAFRNNLNVENNMLFATKVARY